MKLSVLIPCYNMANFIETAINSVINSDIQIIIYNDGSTDNIDEVMNKYIDNPKIKYISNKINHGVGRARNVLIENTDTEFLTWLDADDTIEDLDKIVECIGSKDLYLFKVNNNPIIKLPITSKFSPFIMKGWIHKHMCKYVVRTEVIKDFKIDENSRNGIPEYELQEFIGKKCQNNWKYIVVGNYVYEHRCLSKTIGKLR